MTRIGYALCKVRFYALKVPFWRGRSRFPQGAMHYEILCIISSCIMRYSTVCISLEIWTAQMTYFKLSPISLILVTYSRDATHVIYARLHNEEWISNGHMLHSISSECISMRLFCYSNIPRRRSLTATSSPSTDGPTTGSSLLLLFLWWDRRSHLYWN